MSIFIKSYDYKMWDFVMDSPYVPTKMKTWSGELKPKFRREWTKAEVKKVKINFKSINTLHCALNPTKLNKISTCKSAKEIWDKLKIIHEGTTHVKKSKIISSLINIRCSKYNLMKASHLDLITTPPSSINSTNWEKSFRKISW